MNVRLKLLPFIGFRGEEVRLDESKSLAFSLNTESFSFKEISIN